MSDVAQITENLYVGGWSAAERDGNSFDLIVNCAIDAPCYPKTQQFKLVDGPGNARDDFNRAVECVADAIRANKRTLVHCVSGKSRSVTIAAAAMAKVYKVPFQDILQSIRTSRRCDETQPHSAMLALVEQ